MNWKVALPGEKKKHTRLFSSYGEWTATWGTSGLFRLASAKGSLTPMQNGEPVPDWLVVGWERYWNGEHFDVCLCTEKKPSITTAAVWNTVLELSFGETLSYAEVAVRSGIPGGARAVGAIMRANPWALFLPCHRVIGKDGQLRGYGGPSGVSLKSTLIEFERKLKKGKEGGP